MQEYDLMDRVIGSVVELEKSRTNRFQEVLSERELEVYEWLKTGKSNSEIAACLYVSVNTVKTHLMNIYSKLGVHNRIEALAKIQEITQENHPFG